MELGNVLFLASKRSMKAKKKHSTISSTVCILTAHFNKAYRGMDMRASLLRNSIEPYFTTELFSKQT